MRGRKPDVREKELRVPINEAIRWTLHNQSLLGKLYAIALDRGQCQETGEGRGVKVIKGFFVVSYVEDARSWAP